MAEIEGFDAIISTITLAKELHDIGRLDVVGHFCDALCWDSYYENLLGTISNIFVGFTGDYVEDDEFELMEFEDDVLSNYFIHAWEYGKAHNLHYSQNPYVSQAQEEAQRWLNVNCCVDWKLLAYIRTMKSAQKSKLLVRMYNGCGNGCGLDSLAHGLVQLYAWFKNECDGIEAMKANMGKSKEIMPIICENPKKPEVLVA